MCFCFYFTTLIMKSTQFYHGCHKGNRTVLKWWNMQDVVDFLPAIDQHFTDMKRTVTKHPPLSNHSPIVQTYHGITCLGQSLVINKRNWAIPICWRSTSQEDMSQHSDCVTYMGCSQLRYGPTHHAPALRRLGLSGPNKNGSAQLWGSMINGQDEIPMVKPQGWETPNFWWLNHKAVLFYGSL